MNQIPNIEEVEQTLVKHLVDRFLGWRLPKDFHPDGGIIFMDVYDNGTEQGGKFEPVGTNLFTAEQAKEMFRFLLEHENGTSILTELFHHQLQKARQEERERAVEIIKDELRDAPLEIQMTKGIIFASIVGRIQADLDQDVSK